MKDSFEERLYPPDLGMSPSFAIGRFKLAIRKYGQNIVLTNYKFKKAREIWTTAAFLLGLSKITGKTYWVVPEYQASTPDSYAISFVAHPQCEDGTIREIICIEVSQYEEHSREDLLAAIRRKMSNKHLPDYYILLVQVSRSNEKINLDDVFSELSNKQRRVGEIWLLGTLQDDPDDKYVVACLFPKRSGEFFSLNEELELNGNQTDIITMSRGKGESASQQKLVIKLPDLSMS